MRSLLVLTAHPDDESFFAAGTIAKVVEEGGRVEIVCATRGERGATGGLCSIDELPGVREAELREAARIMGVHEVQFLPYGDQELMSAPVEEIRRYLVPVIRRAKPQVVITFDPNGANLHPDHVAISRFASDAVAAAADPRWYTDAGAAHPIERLLWPSPPRAFELSKIDDLAALPGIDFLIDTSCCWDKKRAALSAHRTQLPGLRKFFFESGDVRKTLSVEAFRIGWGRRPRRIPAADLFAE
jgi:N-acetylglucosamine malate deacetylase 2